MIYDVTYMVQHYVLYGDREEAKVAVARRKDNPEVGIRKYSDEFDEETILYSTKILEWSFTYFFIFFTILRFDEDFCWVKMKNIQSIMR